jgi:hypothetical protein
VISADELATTFKNASTLLKARKHTSANSISGFENGDFESMGREPPCRGQTGEAGADHDYGFIGHLRCDFFERLKSKRIVLRRSLYLLKCGGLTLRCRRSGAERAIQPGEKGAWHRDLLVA